MRRHVLGAERLAQVPDDVHLLLGVGGVELGGIGAAEDDGVDVRLERARLLFGSLDFLPQVIRDRYAGFLQLLHRGASLSPHRCHRGAREVQGNGSGGRVAFFFVAVGVRVRLRGVLRLGRLRDFFLDSLAFDRFIGVRFAMTAVTGSVVRRLPPRADGGAVAETVLRLAAGCCFGCRGARSSARSPPRPRRRPRARGPGRRGRPRRDRAPCGGERARESRRGARRARRGQS